MTKMKPAPAAPARLTLEALHEAFDARTPEASALVTAAFRASLDAITPVVRGDLDEGNPDAVHRLNQAIRLLVGFMLATGEAKPLGFAEMPPIVRAFLTPLRG